MRKKKQEQQVDFVEFGLHKNNSIYLRNASYALGKAAAIAEMTGDTDTLINIAAAWLEIDKDHRRRAIKPKKKPPLGFTVSESSDRMSELEEDDE